MCGLCLGRLAAVACQLATCLYFGWLPYGWLYVYLFSGASVKCYNRTVLRRLANLEMAGICSWPGCAGIWHHETMSSVSAILRLARRG